jgi:hypothetical protein
MHLAAVPSFIHLRLRKLLLPFPLLNKKYS